MKSPLSTRPESRIEPSEAQRERASMLWLLFALLWVLGPHTTHIPTWATATLTLFMGWRLWLTWYRWRAASRWVLTALGFAVVGTVFAQYRTLFGAQAGVTLLVLLLGLKLMEMRATRDIFVVIFLSFFVLFTQFLHSQSIFIAAVMLIAIWALLVALIGTQYTGRQAAFKTQAKLAAILLAWALPMGAVLFVFFPRIQGPLWGSPHSAPRGITGLSDKMEPGSLAQLSQSDAIAFRVKFEDALPPVSERYWRGPVFSAFDGRTWTALRNTALPALHAELDRKVSYTYEVSLEPHRQSWLFALTLPTSTPEVRGEAAIVTPELELRTRSPIQERVRYAVRSHPHFRLLQTDEPSTLAPWLTLPEGSSPRTRLFAQSLKDRVLHETAPPDMARALAEALLNYFKEEAFFYTLQPPVLHAQPIDEFLFETRRGFCEHYASAFVVSMRAMGIPARVVTGYQGGEINPIDGYMAVRQSDAHAWAEIYSEQEGWIRIDPTAAVAPERVQQERNITQTRTWDLPLGVQLSAPSWLHATRMRWEAIQNTWNQRVLSYNPERQRALLGSLGLERWPWEWISAAVVGLLACVFAAIGCLIERPPKPDPARRLYGLACQRLAQRGLKRAPQESPDEFLARARTRLSQTHAHQFTRITQLFVGLLYCAQPSSDSLLAELHRCVKRFKP